MILDYPTGEIVTLPRHLPTRSVRTLMTASTFADRAVFDSASSTADESARSRFTLEVHLTTSDGTRAARVIGTDIYRTGALTMP